VIAHVVVVTLVAVPFVSIEYPEEEQMSAQRTSRLDSHRTADEGRRLPERVRGGSSRHRRHRPGVECLEDRRLPSAIAEFPLPKNDSIGYSSNAALTAGSDGNLWFGENTASGPAIGRITPAGALSSFPLPAGYEGAPSSLTAGPDGNLWFTEYTTAGNVIARITPSGSLAAFALPSGNGGNYNLNSGLTAGPDGNLWFTDTKYTDTFPYASTPAIGRITPAGAITEFPLPTGFGTPSGLTADPDGNLWFSEYTTSGPAIARITSAGAVTEFSVPAVVGSTFSGSLTVGPDGNLWFTVYASSGPAIGRITPAGAITTYALPAGDTLPSSLTAGLDGDLWFTEQPSGAKSPGEIGRITTSGAVSEFPLGSGYSLPSSLTAGPDGNLWFSAQSSGRKSHGAIVRITPAGTFTKFSFPSRHPSPGELTVGPDGNLWFSDEGTGKIGRVEAAAPRVTGVSATARSSGEITSVLITFAAPLDPASARQSRFYGLAAGAASGPTIVFSRGVRIGRVSYDRAADAVRLKLAVPQKGPVQVTVHAGLVAADGMSSSSDYTAVVM
jgi:streptogramin lyase